MNSAKSSSIIVEHTEWYDTESSSFSLASFKVFGLLGFTAVLFIVSFRKHTTSTVSSEEMSMSDPWELLARL